MEMRLATRMAGFAAGATALCMVAGLGHAEPLAYGIDALMADASFFISFGKG